MDEPQKYQHPSVEYIPMPKKSRYGRVPKDMRGDRNRRFRENGGISRAVQRMVRKDKAQ